MNNRSLRWDSDQKKRIGHSHASASCEFAFVNLTALQYYTVGSDHHSESATSNNTDVEKCLFGTLSRIHTKFIHGRKHVSARATDVVAEGLAPERQNDHALRLGPSPARDQSAREGIHGDARRADDHLDLAS